MSILFKNNIGFYISHEEFVNNLYKIDDGKVYQIHPDLFKIISQYLLKKNNVKIRNSLQDKKELQNLAFIELEKDIKSIKLNYNNFLKELVPFLCKNVEEFGNNKALKTAEYVYEQSGKYNIENALGSNNGPATIKKVDESNFLFPENCFFYNKNVSEIKNYLQDNKYDLILLDPPWWNKYIRRKRKKCGNAYNMMYNEDLKNIPIEIFLKEDGLVVVWCTNSFQHLKALKEDIFPKWQVEFVARWFWLKITRSGQPICSFSKPPGKQPFEQIIFGCRRTRKNYPANGKLVVSVPCAIHSHKPPLVELLKEYLPENSKCLEIFARYLLPNWTSYGNEVLRLQHESLFKLNEEIN